MKHLMIALLFFFSLPSWSTDSLSEQVNPAPEDQAELLAKEVLFPRLDIAQLSEQTSTDTIVVLAVLLRQRPAEKIADTLWQLSESFIAIERMKEHPEQAEEMKAKDALLLNIMSESLLALPDQVGEDILVALYSILGSHLREMLSGRGPAIGPLHRAKLIEQVIFNYGLILLHLSQFPSQEGVKLKEIIRGNFSRHLDEVKHHTNILGLYAACDSLDPEAKENARFYFMRPRLGKYYRAGHKLVLNRQLNEKRRAYLKEGLFELNLVGQHLQLTQPPRTRPRPLGHP